MMTLFIVCGYDGRMRNVFRILCDKKDPIRVKGKFYAVIVRYALWHAPKCFSMNTV